MFVGQYMTPTSETKGDIFYFDYGVVALWGLEKHQARILHSPYCAFTFANAVWARKRILMMLDPKEEI